MACQKCWNPQNTNSCQQILRFPLNFLLNTGLVFGDELLSYDNESMIHEICPKFLLHFTDLMGCSMPRPREIKACQIRAS